MGLRQKIQFYRSINWIKTLYFNYKKFPFAIAKKLPVYFYGPVKFQDISGEIIIDAPIKRGMIGFGQQYEFNTVHKGFSEIKLAGKIVFKGHAPIGKDYFIFVGKDAVLHYGHMSTLASGSKIICTNSIIIGNYVQTGADTQITDSNFHPMMNTVTKEVYAINGKVQLGNFNFTGGRVTIMKGTKTPDCCTIASNSLCNNDYTTLGENILIGGMPAKLLKTNISRDWAGEMADMDRWLIV